MFLLEIIIWNWNITSFNFNKPNSRHWWINIDDERWEGHSLIAYPSESENQIGKEICKRSGTLNLPFSTQQIDRRPLHVWPTDFKVYGTLLECFSDLLSTVSIAPLSLRSLGLFVPDCCPLDSSALNYITTVYFSLMKYIVQNVNLLKQNSASRSRS